MLSTKKLYTKILDFLSTKVVKKVEIASGSASGVSVPANSYKDVQVNFGKTFSAVPTVVCSLYSSSTSSDLGRFYISPINEGTTGFTARIFNGSSNARTPAIRWIATTVA